MSIHNNIYSLRNLSRTTIVEYDIQRENVPSQLYNICFTLVHTANFKVGVTGGK